MPRRKPPPPAPHPDDERAIWARTFDVPSGTPIKGSRYVRGYCTVCLEPMRVRASHVWLGVGVRCEGCTPTRVRRMLEPTKPERQPEHEDEEEEREVEDELLAWLLGYGRRRRHGLGARRA